MKKAGKVFAILAGSFTAAAVGVNYYNEQAWDGYHLNTALQILIDKVLMDQRTDLTEINGGKLTLWTDTDAKADKTRHITFDFVKKEVCRDDFNLESDPKAHDHSLARCMSFSRYNEKGTEKLYKNSCLAAYRLKDESFQDKYCGPYKSYYTPVAK